MPVGYPGIPIALPSFFLDDPTISYTVTLYLVFVIFKLVESAFVDCLDYKTGENILFFYPDLTGDANPTLSPSEDPMEAALADII